MPPVPAQQGIGYSVLEPGSFSTFAGQLPLLPRVFKYGVQTEISGFVPEEVRSDSPSTSWLRSLISLTYNIINIQGGFGFYGLDQRAAKKMHRHHG